MGEGWPSPPLFTDNVHSFFFAYSEGQSGTLIWLEIDHVDLGICLITLDPNGNTLIAKDAAEAENMTRSIFQYLGLDKAK